jgi:hypothetical protein
MPIKYLQEMPVYLENYAKRKDAVISSRRRS